MGRMAQQVTRGLDGAIDTIRSVGTNTKVASDYFKSSSRGFHDFYREQARQKHVVGIKAGAAAFLGKSVEVAGRGTGYNALAPETRAIAGIGYDENLRVVDRGASPAAATVIESQAHPLAAALGKLTSTLQLTITAMARTQAATEAMPKPDRVSTTAARSSMPRRARSRPRPTPESFATQSTNGHRDHRGKPARSVQEQVLVAAGSPGHQWNRRCGTTGRARRP